VGGARVGPAPTGEENAMRVSAGIQFVVWLVVMLVGGLIALAVFAANQLAGFALFVTTLLVAWLAASAVRLAADWERAIVLRLGKFQAERGPGLFFVTPIIDSVPYVIDLRTMTTVFKAEQTMTHDTVPVDVDAVLFWRVVNPDKA